MLSAKEMSSAADTWTAEGDWAQPLREPSKPRQPNSHESKASAGRCSWTPLMNTPVCWLAYPSEVLGWSQEVPVKVSFSKRRLRAGRVVGAADLEQRLELRQLDPGLRHVLAGSGL